ncbi:hypothetical protein ACQJBY_041685 [Aegilops geniculata]
MAARTALGSALMGIRALRQASSRMVEVFPGRSSICSPSASKIPCLLPLEAGARYFCTKKEPDSLLRDNVKQAVLHGLRDALGKSKNDDISGLKLSVIREGVAAALKESLYQYNICFDCDDTDPHIRIMIQEAVEEVLKAYGYQIPKKDTKSGASTSLISGHARSTGAEFSAQGAASWDPGFGLPGSSQPNDPSDEEFDPRLLALMRYVGHCVAKSVDIGFEDALKRKLQPDSGEPTLNDEEADDEPDEDWTFSDARFARQNRRFRKSEEKKEQKRREQDAKYTRLMNEKAARAEEARKEDRLELIKEGVLGLQRI